MARPAADPLVTFTDLGAVGGTYQAVAADPATARTLVGMEGRIGVVDVRVAEVPLLLHRTAPLSENVTDIAIIGGRAWIAAGGAGLFSMDITTDTPEPGPPIGVPPGAHRLATDPPFVLAATDEGAVLLNADDPTFQAVMGTGPVTDVALARFTAYVLQGDQILVFDITKPALPKEARAIRLDAQGMALAASRSLLLVSDGDSSLRVYGLDNPRNPRRRGALDSKHVVADILPIGAYAYLATESGVRAVHVLADPTEMGGNRNQNTASSSLAADGSRLYGAGTGGLTVMDVSQPSFPRPVGSMPTMSDGLELSLRGGLLYAAESGALTLADVTLPLDAIVLSRLNLGFPEALAHLGDYVLIGDGSLMYVVDAADPRAPRPVAVLPVRGGSFQRDNEYVTDIQVSGTTAFLANGRFGGLTVVDVTSPTLPAPLAVITSTGFATRLALTGPAGAPPNLALVGDSQEGVLAYDIRDPLAPVKLGASGGTWFPYSLAVWDDVVVIVAGEDGVLFYRVESDPESANFGQMRRLTSWWPGLSARSIAIHDGLAYVGGDSGSGCRLVAIDLTDPTDPWEAGCWEAAGAVEAVTADGDLMAVSAYGEGVRLVRLTRAAAPPTATRTPTVAPVEMTPTATAAPQVQAVYLPAVTTDGATDGS